MWRRILWAILLGLALLSIPAVAMAANPVVTITMSAWVVGTPEGLILTYISDYQVDISWTKGEDAENTMVRGAVGRIPEDRNDGYLVYYGDGTSASDTGVSLDETAAPVYYRAWSQNASGAWEEEGIFDWIEGIGVTLIAFVCLAVGLTGVTLWRRHVLLYLSAFIGLLLIGVYLGDNLSWSLGGPVLLLSGYMFYEFIMWWF